LFEAGVFLSEELVGCAYFVTLFDLEDDLDYDRRADWQTLNTVHRPHMTVFDTEQLNKQIRCPVSDGGVLNKLLGRNQNNAQLHQLL
jgi:hypothetical protein